MRHFWGAGGELVDPLGDEGNVFQAAALANHHRLFHAPGSRHKNTLKPVKSGLGCIGGFGAVAHGQIPFRLRRFVCSYSYI